MQLYFHFFSFLVFFYYLLYLFLLIESSVLTGFVIQFFFHFFFFPIFLSFIYSTSSVFWELINMTLHFMFIALVISTVLFNWFCDYSWFFWNFCRSTTVTEYFIMLLFLISPLPLFKGPMSIKSAAFTFSCTIFSTTYGKRRLLLVTLESIFFLFSISITISFSAFQ